MVVLFVNPFSPSQLISVLFLLTLSTQNNLFGNENIVNDHTRQSISKMKNNILPTSSQRHYRDSLGEFCNTSYGVFGAERVKERD